MAKKFVDVGWLNISFENKSNNPSTCVTHVQFRKANGAGNELIFKNGALQADVAGVANAAAFLQGESLVYVKAYASWNVGPGTRWTDEIAIHANAPVLAITVNTHWSKGWIDIDTDGNHAHADS
jgi:hypothetical protein